MKTYSLIIAILIVVMGCGCASRNYYDGLRFRQEMDCQKLQGAARDECSRKSAISYEEYQRQLKEREQKK